MIDTMTPRTHAEKKTVDVYRRSLLWTPGRPSPGCRLQLFVVFLWYPPKWCSKMMYIHSYWILGFSFTFNNITVTFVPWHFQAKKNHLTRPLVAPRRSHPRWGQRVLELFTLRMQAKWWRESTPKSTCNKIHQNTMQTKNAHECTNTMQTKKKCTWIYSTYIKV